MPNRNTATSLMDNSEFIAELETLDGANAAASSSSQLLDHPYEAERHPEQRRRHLVVPERSRDHSRRSTMPDRNVFQPAPIDQDDEVDAEDETSVTISGRVAAFAVMASGVVGVVAAAVVFHARWAVFLR